MSKKTKMIVAFMLTPLLALAMGYWLLNRLSLPQAPLKHKVKITARPEPLFYRSVGLPRPVDERVEVAKSEPKYTLELMVTGDIEAAKKMVSDLNKKGVDAFYTPFNRQGDIRYRVRFGLFPTEAIAQKNKEILKTYGLEGTVTVF